jgi:uncharacterized membrane protein YqhA
MRKFISASRYMVLPAVAGAFIAATTLIIYGFASILLLLAETIQYGAISAKGGKALSLGFIESIDLFLLGTVFYIISLGLYELFIDDTIPLPEWLVIHSLDDLKDKLIGVVVVVMAVVFLGNVVNWHGEPGIIYLGAAIAFVVVSVTWFLSQKKKAKSGDPSAH